MTQTETIIDLLRKNEKVTLRMLFDAGVGYTARNRIGELRRSGWTIKTIKHDPAKGETISDNGYQKISEPTDEVQFRTDHKTGQPTFA